MLDSEHGIETRSLPQNAHIDLTKDALGYLSIAHSTFPAIPLLCHMSHDGERNHVYVLGGAELSSQETEKSASPRYLLVVGSKDHFPPRSPKMRVIHGAPS